MKPRGHHWVLIVVVIAVAYHYRAQLLAIWHTNVAPLLASVLPPSAGALLGMGTHPLDIPPSSRPSDSLDAFGGGGSGRGSSVPYSGIGAGQGGVGGQTAVFYGGFANGAPGTGQTPEDFGPDQIGNVPTGSGHCSRRAADGKILCTLFG